MVSLLNLKFKTVMRNVTHHIYRDGGLALATYLAQNVDRHSTGMYKLSALHSQLVSNRSLKILEIGSGYDKHFPYIIQRLTFQGVALWVWPWHPYMIGVM